jgi:hypothetical protein
MKDAFTPLEDQDLPLGAVPASSLGREAVTGLAFSSVAVLPEQFFNLPPHHYKGEAALMYAVLEDAFNCFAKQFVDNGSGARRLAEEAEAWFFSKDERWPFSFVNVCTVLGINPEYICKGLEQCRRQRRTQKRHIRGRGLSRPLYLRAVA